MLLPEDAGVIKAPQLGSLESVVVADNVFNSVEGNNFAVDEEITVSFTGLPQPTALQSLSDFFDGRTYVNIIIWVVGIALLAVLGYALYSSRKNHSLSSEDVDEFAIRGDIVAAIAALDEEYNVKRDELKRLALEFDEESPTDDDTDEVDASDSTESEDNSSEEPEK